MQLCHLVKPKVSLITVSEVWLQEWHLLHSLSSYQQWQKTSVTFLSPGSVSTDGTDFEASPLTQSTWKAEPVFAHISFLLQRFSYEFVISPGPVPLMPHLCELPTATGERTFNRNGHNASCKSYCWHQATGLDGDIYSEWMRALASCLTATNINSQATCVIKGKKSYSQKEERTMLEFKTPCVKE